MRYKVQEKPFTPNQKTLNSDTEKILDQMQNNFNESFVNSQKYNHENGGNNKSRIPLSVEDGKQYFLMNYLINNIKWDFLSEKQ